MTLPAASGTAEERLQRYLLTLPGAPSRIVSLTGDASDRRYFRVFTGTGSMVAAVHAGPIEYATLPFANVAGLFAAVPLPIPQILGHSDPDGVVAQSDLGDVTLQAHLELTDAAGRARFYQDAVAMIARLQRRGRELDSPRFLPYRLAFDVEKLTFELNFFVRHFLEAYRGIALADTERQALNTEWAGITSELAGEPRVVCHRDYHSRNLMVLDGQLHVIDFQDARMGPDTYDLVSLLRDSYVELSDAEVDGLIEQFRGLTADAGTRDEFRRRFDLMALQRNLKALGTFGFQTTSRNNPAYAQYVPRTLTYVRRHLATYPRFAGLREILSRHVTELA